MKVHTYAYVAITTGVSLLIATGERTLVVTVHSHLIQLLKVTRTLIRIVYEHFTSYGYGYGNQILPGKNPFS